MTTSPIEKLKTVKNYIRLSIKHKTPICYPCKDETNVFKIPLSYKNNDTGEVIEHIKSITSSDGPLGPVQTTDVAIYTQRYIKCTVNEGDVLKLIHSGSFEQVTLKAVKVRNGSLLLVDESILNNDI